LLIALLRSDYEILVVSKMLYKIIGKDVSDRVCEFYFRLVWCIVPLSKLRNVGLLITLNSTFIQGGSWGDRGLYTSPEGVSIYM